MYELKVVGLLLTLAGSLWLIIWWLATHSAAKAAEQEAKNDCKENHNVQYKWHSSIEEGRIESHDDQDDD